MKTILPATLITTLVIFIFSCSHKNDAVTQVTIDTAASSNYKITMFPETEALYNLSNAYKTMVDGKISLNATLVLTKQTNAIAGASSDILSI